MGLSLAVGRKILPGPDSGKKPGREPPDYIKCGDAIGILEKYGFTNSR